MNHWTLTSNYGFYYYTNKRAKTNIIFYCICGQLISFEKKIPSKNTHRTHTLAHCSKTWSSCQLHQRSWAEQWQEVILLTPCYHFCPQGRPDPGRWMLCIITPYLSYNLESTDILPNSPSPAKYAPGPSHWQSPVFKIKLFLFKQGYSTVSASLTWCWVHCLGSTMIDSLPRDCRLLARAKWNTMTPAWSLIGS